MKMPKQITAEYKVQVGVAQRIKEEWGTITYSDNKLSISIPNRRYNSSATNHQIKTTVEREFDGFGNAPFNYRTSSIFSNIVESNNDLVEVLRNNTQELKAAFIEKTKEYAKVQFDNATKKLKMSDKARYEMYQVPYTTNVHGQIIVDWKANYRTAFHEMQKAITKARMITDKGYTKFEEKEVRYAEMHYESSLIKLTDRLSSKGIIDNFEITSGRVGVNFEVTIKHEKGITRAWTIIAEGLIQRPHYRYLVK